MKQVLQTLAYHSIFDYPLTERQIFDFLIAARPTSLQKIKAALNKLCLQRRVVRAGRFFCLPRSKPTDQLRCRRQAIARKKLILASKAARAISLIPWVKLVAITGTLAMENTRQQDDVDLMIIIADDRLWLTRLLTVFFAAAFFKRRTPSSRGNRSGHGVWADAICLNLWLEESAMTIPQNRRNLYVAHELAQLRPVVNRQGIYEKLLWQNKWGEKYLANFWGKLGRPRSPRGEAGRLGGQKNLNPASGVLTVLNKLAFRLQYWYMKPKMTREKVSVGFAYFHPIQRDNLILRVHAELLKKIGINTSADRV